MGSLKVKYTKTQHIRTVGENHKSLKRDLINMIITLIEKNKMKPSEAAEVMGIHRSRVSDIVTRKDHKFTLDSLIVMLASFDVTVGLTYS